MGTQILALEISTPAGTLYAASGAFSSQTADTPSARLFEPTLAQDIEFKREVSTHFWGGSPRGSMSFGVVRLLNPTGRYDSLVAYSLRDYALVIKRGSPTSAYSTFTTVASLIIDRAVFSSEDYVDLYVTDIGAKLERSAQTTLYSSGISNQALRQKPIPFSIGRCFQVPLVERETTGNRHADVHDTELWLGTDKVMDAGAALLPSRDRTESTAPLTNSYRRSLLSSVNGIERRTAIGGRQVANVQGALNVLSTALNDDCSALTNWTETNGGVGGRDVSLSGGGFRILNTAGGATLSLTQTASNTSAAGDLWLYSVTVSSYTSGYVRLTFGGTIEREIKETGRFTGIVERTANFQMGFEAVSGSNCDLIVDNIVLRKVELIETVDKVIRYVATSDGVTNGKGPLTVSDLDTAAIDTLKAATNYKLGAHINSQMQIADLMDQIMITHGGWWYVNRLGKLTVGRLEAPSGSPVAAFTEANIMDGLSIEFDPAKGLSNRILAQRNSEVYAPDEVAAALNYVALDPVAKGAAVAISNSNMKYTNTGLGSARASQIHFGDRLYFEVTANTVASTHRIGATGLGVALSGAPSLAYSSDGQKVKDGAGTAYGATYTAADVIGVAIDYRQTARGQSSASVASRVWWSKAGAFQASGNPATDANPAYNNLDVAQFAFPAAGATATGNSGTFNFGHAAFAYTPPAEYDSPAAQKTLVTSQYRFQYQTSTALAAAYAQAIAREALSLSSDNVNEYLDGTATWFSVRADATTECDRWGALFNVERFFYEFDALMEATTAETLDPGALISLTHSRYSLSAELLRLVSISGSLLGNKVRIRGWG